MADKPGRNDPCTCGSGKKYKNCCLNSSKCEFPKPSSRIQSNVDTDLVKKFIETFNEYNFFDLARAVFCMNAWRGNRPELQFYLSLNKALFDCEKNGEKSISTYQEFEEFFKTIKTHYKFSQYVDENVPDFGEVKIRYNEKFYPVILGNGYSFVYSLMQLVEPLAYYKKCINEFESVLKYVKEMLYALKPNNPHNKNKSIGDLFLPSKKFFNECVQWYKKRNSDEFGELFAKLLLKKQEIVDKEHFVSHENDLYPLFNPSIIIDAYHALEQTLNETERNDFSAMALWTTLLNNFSENPDEEKIFYNVGVIESEENNKVKLLESKRPAFLILGRKKALLLIDESKLTPKQLMQYVATVKRQQKNGGLRLITPPKEGHNLVIPIEGESRLTVVSFDAHTNLENYIKMIGRDEMFRYSLLDIVYMLHSAESVDEVCEFVEFDFGGETMFAMSMCDGTASKFEIWKQGGKEISHGALNIGGIWTELNLPEWTQLGKFKELEEFFPFDYPSYMFNFANKWILHRESNTTYFKFIFNKAMRRFGGRIKKINESIIFIAYNLDFYNETEAGRQEFEKFQLIDDMISRGFEVYEKILVNSGFYKPGITQVMYMPWDYAKKVDKTGFLKSKREYVYSDAYIDNGQRVIRFTIDKNAFFKDLEDCQTRKVECLFFIELLKCCESVFSYEEFEDSVEKDFSAKKATTIKSQMINYYISDNNLCSWPNDEVYIKVNKQLAIIAAANKIKEDKYKKQAATKVVRTMQTALVNHLEQEITKYSQIDLHKRLLSRLAHYTFEKKRSSTVYNLGNQPLDAEIARRTKESALNNRNNSKARIRNLLYAIESNLFVERDSTICATHEQLDYLVAFAAAIVELQDDSDAAYFKNEAVEMIVSNDFRVSVNAKDKNLFRKSQRVLESEDYLPNNSTNDDSLKKLVSLISADIGVKFELALSFLNYLSWEFNHTFKVEIKPDVFEIDAIELLTDFESIQIDKSKFAKKDYTDALEYWIADSKRLKVTADKNGVEVSHNFLPIWERRYRGNRFDVKPLLRVNGKIVFSPVVCRELFESWLYGLDKLYPPYEIGLNSLMKKLQEKQNFYEKSFETDVAKLFGNKNGILLPKYKFKDCKDDIGDYDVIFIDRNSKVIWNIECKYLGYIGSTHEYYNMQKRFFSDTKNYKEKFEARISYLTQNVKNFLTLQKINDSDAYQIKNVMVTNKVFEPTVELKSFEIISYDELGKILKQ